MSEAIALLACPEGTHEENACAPSPKLGRGRKRRSSLEPSRDTFAGALHSHPYDTVLMDDVYRTTNAFAQDSRGTSAKHCHTSIRGKAGSPGLNGHTDVFHLLSFHGADVLIPRKENKRK